MLFRNLFSSAVIAGLFLLSSPGGAAADLQLVDDGMPVCCIVISEKASDVTHSAARVMQEYVEKASGARVPIYIEESLSLNDVFWWYADTTIIAIGDTKLARDAGLTADTLAPEGFLIKTAGNTLFILGREDRLDTTRLRSTGWNVPVWEIPREGTLFGVWTFLEDYMGVRWLWPGELGEVVPESKNISVPKIDRTEKPAFAIRIIRPALLSSANKNAATKLGESGGSLVRRLTDTIDWTRKMKMGRSMVIDQTHSFGDAFFDKHSKDHPDWFALMPGFKRAEWRTAYSDKPGLDRARLCLSNRGLQDEVARMVLEKAEENPALKGVSVGLDDVSRGEVYCTCDDCKAFGTTLSDRVMRFSSEVAERVAAQKPDLYVSQFAYADWREPPVEARVHPNVAVWFVGTFTSGYMYDSDRVSNWKLWDGWADKVKGKMIWRPNLPPTLGIPTVFYKKLSEDIRRFAPKMHGLDIDCLDLNWASRGLDWYVVSKLMWNPDLDVEAIVDDYCQSGFGPAWRQVREYFDAVERNTSELARLAPQAGYHMLAPVAFPYYDAARIARLRALLDAAARAAKGHKTVLRRIDFLRLNLDWLDVSRRAWQIYAAKGDKEEAKTQLRAIYGFLRKHADSYSIHAANIESKIGWMWRNYIGDADEHDWAQAQ